MFILANVPGHSFLHHAARLGHKDAIITLIEAGYDINMNSVSLITYIFNFKIYKVWNNTSRSGFAFKINIYNQIFA